jgi:hypothetical protein
VLRGGLVLSIHFLSEGALVGGFGLVCVCVCVVEADLLLFRVLFSFWLSLLVSLGGAEKNSRARAFRPLQKEAQVYCVKKKKKVPKWVGVGRGPKTQGHRAAEETNQPGSGGNKGILYCEGRRRGSRTVWSRRASKN